MFGRWLDCMWPLRCCSRDCGAAQRTRQRCSRASRRRAAARRGIEVTTLHASGTLGAGGMSGDMTFVQDLATGRSADAYKLGPVDGADGYDGTLAWTRDPGGEVAALDTPEAKRRARSQAWLDARAFWYPERIHANYGAVADRDADGKHYRVVEATPADGDPLTLWFDPSSGLLVRTVQRQGQDTRRPCSTTTATSTACASRSRR